MTTSLKSRTPSIELIRYISHLSRSELLLIMVGGVETAGLVLAALSLIIKGVVHYADGVRTIRKWWQCRRELESLARTLEVERVLFLGTCEKLLDEVVINDDLFVKLIENPGSPEWKDEQLDQKFKQHLGSKHSLYQSLIEDMNSAVKELVRQLEIDEQGKVCSSKPLDSLQN